MLVPVSGADGEQYYAWPRLGRGTSPPKQEDLNRLAVSATSICFFKLLSPLMVDLAEEFKSFEKRGDLVLQRLKEVADSELKAFADSLLIDEELSSNISVCAMLPPVLMLFEPNGEMLGYMVESIRWESKWEGDALLRSPERVQKWFERQGLFWV